MMVLCTVEGIYQLVYAVEFFVLLQTNETVRVLLCRVSFEGEPSEMINFLQNRVTEVTCLQPCVTDWYGGP